MPHHVPSVGDRAARRRMSRAASHNEPASEAVREAVYRCYGPVNGPRIMAGLAVQVAEAREATSVARRHLVGVSFDDSRPAYPPAVACRWPG